MPYFKSDGIDIAYVDEGEGEPILLIHGFASNIGTNWRGTSWIDTLVADGRRVIAIDNRGHGQSEKLYEPERYGAPAMAEDACRLLDHLGIDRADVMGYSMGARIASFLTLAPPEPRAQPASSPAWASIWCAAWSAAGRWQGRSKCRASTTSTMTRRVASAPSPRRPGATSRHWPPACGARARSSRAEQLGTIKVPTLVAVGSADVIAGSGPELAALIPGARLLSIEGRDHMKAVGDPRFKQGVLDFLAQRV